MAAFSLRRQGQQPSACEQQFCAPGTQRQAGAATHPARMSAPDFNSPLRTRSRMISTILSDVRGPKSGRTARVPDGCQTSARAFAGAARARTPVTISASSSSSSTSSASSSCDNTEKQCTRPADESRPCASGDRPRRWRAGCSCAPSSRRAAHPQRPASLAFWWCPACRSTRRRISERHPRAWGSRRSPHAARRRSQLRTRNRPQEQGACCRVRHRRATAAARTLKMRSMSACAFSLNTRLSLASTLAPSALAVTRCALNAPCARGARAALQPRRSRAQARRGAWVACSRAADGAGCCSMACALPPAQRLLYEL